MTDRSAIASPSTVPSARQYVSLYNYTRLSATELPRWRRRILAVWRQLDVRGRVYLAEEGINAQLTVPATHVETLAQSFPDIFSPTHLNLGGSVPATGPTTAGDKSLTTTPSEPFDHLKVHLRRQIVADGFDKGHLDLQDSGNALPPDQWHHKLRTLLQQPSQAQHDTTTTDAANEAAPAQDNTLVLDVRNFYEHEIGRFDGATRIMVDTFRDTFDALDEILEEHRAAHGGRDPEEVMMYCTGGIRCEKVGAYLRQYKGIEQIHKLQGGTVNYQRFLRANPETTSLFKGKNFVFDQRCVAGVDGSESEEVTADVLGKCFQCGAPCNDHTNCSNLMCGGLLLQCPACRVANRGACSEACKEEFLKMETLEESERRKYRREHAHQWNHRVPNGLSRIRGLTFASRGYCSSSGSSLVSEARSSMDLNMYVHSVSTELPDEDLLQTLRAKTRSEWPKAEQLIDEPQGKLLSFLVQLTGAKDVLEIGCFTGYSAICLANGLPPSGKLTTCDVDASTMTFARSYFVQSAKRDQINSVVADGMEYLQQCASDGRKFDLIFVDANKRQYINYYETILAKELLEPNGLLAFDNTLFRGRVLAFANGEANKKERIAKGLNEFNMHVGQDPRTINVLLPLWDGLTLVRLRSA